MTSIKQKIMATIAAPLLVGTLAVVPTTVDAFSASSSVNYSGTTYTASATSCNFYLTSCSYTTKGTTSTTKSFTQKGWVKANGLNVKVTITKPVSVSISGNSTTLVSTTKAVYGTSFTTSGQASPSIFSVSVAAKSNITASGVNLSTGWTTW